MIRDLTGLEFGKLKVLYQSDYKLKSTRATYWHCVCKCGNEKAVRGTSLTSYKTVSCGCQMGKKHPATRKANTISRSKEYITWSRIKARCYNIKSKSYKNYGGRGITISPDWLNSFENFLRDIGTAPTTKHSIDRIDVNLGYYKENCRWSLNDIQSNNKTTNIFVDYEGKTLTISQWAKEFNISSHLVRRRYHKGIRGEALFVKSKGIPISERKTKNPEYQAWKHMKSRCYNITTNCYKNYGGRGITVCDRWLHSFVTFLQDMGNKPGHKYSLDRKDVNGNYTPENCCWSNTITQANNKTNNIVITYNNETLTLSQWAVKLNMPYSKLKTRYEIGFRDTKLFSVETY